MLRLVLAALLLSSYVWPHQLIDFYVTSTPVGNLGALQVAISYNPEVLLVQSVGTNGICEATPGRITCTDAPTSIHVVFKVAEHAPSGDFFTKVATSNGESKVRWEPREIPVPTPRLWLPLTAAAD